MSFGGFVSVALAVTRKAELAADPEVELIGIPETTAGGNTPKSFPSWSENPPAATVTVRARGVGLVARLERLDYWDGEE